MVTVPRAILGQPSQNQHGSNPPSAPPAHDCPRREPAGRVGPGTPTTNAPTWANVGRRGPPVWLPAREVFHSTARAADALVVYPVQLVGMGFAAPGARIDRWFGAHRWIEFVRNRQQHPDHISTFGDSPGDVPAPLPLRPFGEGGWRSITVEDYALLDESQRLFPEAVVMEWAFSPRHELSLPNSTSHPLP
jgi:hypothetical protein